MEGIAMEEVEPQSTETETIVGVDSEIKNGVDLKEDQNSLIPKEGEELSGGNESKMIQNVSNQPERDLLVPSASQIVESLPSMSSSAVEIEEQLTGVESPAVTTVTTMALAQTPAQPTVLHSTISVVPTGFDQQVSSTFLKEKITPVAPGTKDSEGFLAPPPASTLLIRRARVSGTGVSTYVVSKSDSSSAAEADYNTNSTATGASLPSVDGTLTDETADDSHIRRRPGRPVGSTCKYKKGSPTSSDGQQQVQAPAEVRVSSRSSSSIFKHDGSTPALNIFGSSSQWIYPLPFRPPHMSVGKPPMTGQHSHSKPYSKGQKKDRAVNIDPLTGKRKYTKRKKIGLEKKQKGISFVDGDHVHGRPRQHLSDNGVWRPTDDLRLIVNTTAVDDLEKVYVGVKFSCYFTYKEIEDRWRKLMYGEKSSLCAQNAINALHPQVKAMIYSEALFSPDEEKLISSVKSDPLSNPDISSFQLLLDENFHVFNKHRTARNLMMHWLNMRDFHLLPGQDVMQYDVLQNFEDYEEIIVDEDIQNEPRDEAIAQEVKNDDRNIKKKIRIVDDELTSWQMLIEQIIDDGRKDRTLPAVPTGFNNKTFAILRGLQVLYLMTSREITLGRSTKENKVDADLTQEGSSNKISRKQAIIMLKDMGKFVIINKGRNTIFVDRKAVSYKCAATLHDQSVIQISHISLVFMTNEPLIEKLVERDVRREVYASFKDLETDLPLTPTKSDSRSAYCARESPGSLYTNSTTNHSRNSMLGSYGEIGHSPNWGHPLGYTEPTSPGGAARANSTDALRYNLPTGLQTSSESVYQSMKYPATPPSSSKGLLTATTGMTPLVSNVKHVKHSSEKETTVPDNIEAISMDTSAPRHWESPVSSLTQCSIGQMSGSVSSVSVPQNYSEDVTSKTLPLVQRQIQ